MSSHDEWDGDGDGELAEPGVAQQNVEQPVATAPEKPVQPVQGARWRMTNVPQPLATHPQREEAIPVSPIPASALVEEKLPETYAELLAETKRLEGILRQQKWTAKNVTREQRAEHRRLANRYAAVKKKAHEVQQGNMTPVIGANEMEAAHGNQRATLRRQRWEIIAKGDMHFRDLLAERDDLEFKNSVLKARLAEHEGDAVFNE